MNSVYLVNNVFLLTVETSFYSTESVKVRHLAHMLSLVEKLVRYESVSDTSYSEKNLVGCSTTELQEICSS